MTITFLINPQVQHIGELSLVSPCVKLGEDEAASRPPLVAFKAQLAHNKQGFACLVGHIFDGICSDKMASKPLKICFQTHPNRCISMKWFDVN